MTYTFPQYPGDANAQKNEEQRNTRKAFVVLSTSGNNLGLLEGCANMQSAIPVTWSAGTERARIIMPVNATDCHHHIYDLSYPWAPEATLKSGCATVDDYRKLQKRIGTTRNVIVQPSSYGVDNRLLLASIAQFNNRARGIAVVDTSVTQAELNNLHQGGIRGIRFNLAPPGTTTLDMILPLARRIARMGWHIQVNASATDLLHAKTTWYDLPCPVVFDHLAHVPEPNPLAHPAFDMVADLISANRAYVKLTGFYMDTLIGPPHYPDSVALAAAFAAEAPSRVLWGSDWPHPTEQPHNRIPDDALLADLLQVVIPDETSRKLILVENPSKLYDF